MLACARPRNPRRPYLRPAPPHQVGWEEEAEASLTHLLRTSLARSSKEAAVSVPPLAAAKDTQRLRKHLGLVLERLAKGARLVAPPDGAPPGRSAAAVAVPQQQG